MYISFIYTVTVFLLLFLSSNYCRDEKYQKKKTSTFFLEPYFIIHCYLFSCLEHERRHIAMRKKNRIRFFSLVETLGMKSKNAEV